MSRPGRPLGANLVPWVRGPYLCYLKRSQQWFSLHGAFVGALARSNLSFVVVTFLPSNDVHQITVFAQQKIPDLLQAFWSSIWELMRSRMQVYRMVNQMILTLLSVLERAAPCRRGYSTVGDIKPGLTHDHNFLISNWVWWFLSLSRQFQSWAKLQDRRRFNLIIINWNHRLLFKWFPFS